MRHVLTVRILGLVCGHLVLSGLAVSVARAQLPGTDIWLAPLVIGTDGVSVGTGVNVTARPGYDNQPMFVSPGGFLYASGDSSGTDVFRWDGVTRTTSPVTRSLESEYSPTPLADGSGFCAVRVEADSTQRLWRFDMDGGNPRLVMADVDSIGYFEWIDAGTLAVFVVGDPHTLRIVDVASQQETVVARDIGRFIRCAPGTHDVTFTRRNPDDTHRFMLLPEGAAQPRLLVEGVGGQDAVWAGEWLLATAGAEIFAVRPSRGEPWKKVADVSGWGPAAATRLALSPDGGTLAVVCAE